MENKQNIISVIKHDVKFDKPTLIKIHLVIRLAEEKIEHGFSDRELSILSELYCVGGVTDKESIENFSIMCFDKGLCKTKSVQSIRNVLGEARELGVIKRRKSNNWKIDDKYLPKVDGEMLVFKYALTDNRI